MATNLRIREHEAQEAAKQAARTIVKLSDSCEGDCEAPPDECATKRLFAAIFAYGRAVREADKEAASGVQPQQTCSFDKYDAAWAAGNWAGHKEAAAAIEALGREE